MLVAGTFTVALNVTSLGLVLAGTYASSCCGYRRCFFTGAVHQMPTNTRCALGVVAVVGATASTTLSYILPGTFYIQVGAIQHTAKTLAAANAMIK